ncbi:MAG: hypothetical protein ACR2KP_16600 [Egibacteraceae bacterium]
MLSSRAGDGPHTTSQPVPLGGWGRFLSGLLAAAGGGAGGAAVFLTDNGAGAVALLGVGALFGVLAVTGHGLQRIAVVASELSDDQFARERLLDAVDELPLDQRERVAARIDAPAEDGEALPTAWARAVRYEAAVGEALHHLAATRAWLAVEVMPAGLPAGLDFVVHGPRTVGVLVHRSTGGLPEERLCAQGRRALESGAPPGAMVLIVIDAVVPTAFAERLPPGVRATSWHAGDPDRLAETVLRLIG